MSDPNTALFLTLGIVLMVARIAGTIARRFDQPRVLGELLSGVLLGPTVLNMLHSPMLGLDHPAVSLTVGATLQQLAQIGVVLLLFSVGLEVQPVELIKAGRVAGVAGISGSLLSVILSMLLMRIAGYTWQAALFTGVALAATSVSISAQVLLELGRLRSKVGNALLGAALTDDIAGIILLSLAIALTGSAISSGSVFVVIIRLIAYLIIAFMIAWFILPRLLNRLEGHPNWTASFGIPVVALAIVFLFGWSADYLGGVASITGAFVAGIGISRVSPSVKHAIETAVSHLAFGFLVPIFFISIGLQTDLRTLPISAVSLGLGLLVIAIGGKLIGCGGGARLAGFSPQESLQLGACMIPRGEVSLIAVTAGASGGIFKPGDPLFAILFLMIILTAVLTPLAVRRVFQVPTKPLAAKRKS